ncbi:MAG: hypothetical protein KA341_01905 [Saprospiraceae bacterium]|nr:hypothetical protein [Saprospiraceae bacterium]
MKSTLLPFVTMMTLLFLLPTGCRKDDSVSQPEQADEQLMRDFLSDDYFATASEYYNPPPADPSAGTATESRTKTSMTAALKDYFAKNPKEVKNITKDLGYPIWHHTTYAVVEDEEILHIPFAKTNKNKIESVLYVSKSKDQNKLSFNMVLRKDLEKFDREKKIKKNKKVNKKKEQFSSLSKEMAVTTVAYFEQVVFQQVDCALAEMMKDDNFKPDDKVESRECFYVSYSQTTDWYQYGGGNISYLGSSTSYGGQWVCIYTYAYGPDGTTNVETTNTTGGVNTSSSEIYTDGDDIVRYYISDKAPEGICPNSINFITTGGGRTACIEDRYRMVSTNGLLYWVNLTYCITIPGWMNVSQAQEIIADNLDAAKDYAHSIYRAGAQTTTGTVRGTIDEMFKEYNLADLNYSSVSSGRCQNVPCNDIKYSDFWGRCP